MKPKVALIGYGYVGKAYHKMFPDAVIYDEPQKIFVQSGLLKGKLIFDNKEEGRAKVNECDIALIAVPTDLLKDGTLDTSIVEEVVGWLETPLILIKSALMPGTTDRLVKQTGKDIAVSVELIGEGSYFTPPWKYPNPKNPTQHQTIIVGGKPDVAEACAEILWDRMSPDTRIHLTTAVEAELTKLMENAWGAMKVTFSNVMYDVAQKYNASFIKVREAWRSDPRVEGMHTRVVSFKRGWKSKCYDKDVPTLAKLADSEMLKGLVKDNHRHLNG